MEVTYFDDTDSIIIASSIKGCGGGSSDLRDNMSIILTYADEWGIDKTVAMVEIFGVTVGNVLPLSAEHGYDAETDTLTLGDKGDRSVADFHIEENDEFIAYFQCDEGIWQPAAVDIRNASKYLAEVNETIIRKLRQESEASAG